ncbi:DUF2939 domain-containing protein [Microbulbifer elongatus]|uniref:DUF2939 domain-containing protein n=1 Tax=Microbulbifer elongatus TaxID=86173 RepID=A0ABT1NYR8_9GAMM|nr:DUF2939 domain-containing protein [Microbulbifer elongatus]MCQ3828982.1 DUF2939 domain-containing protein [Microbulbifer elongatus]
MNGKWLLRIGLVSLLLIMVYAALPWYSARQLIEAAQHNDVAKLERYVDFPQLRGNIRLRLQEEVHRSLAGDLPPELGELFSAGADLFLEPLLKRLISPEGITQLIQGQRDWREFERELNSLGTGKHDRPHADNSAASANAGSDSANGDDHGHHWHMEHWYFSGHSTVEVVCGNREDDQLVQLQLQRSGLRWRLVDIRKIDDLTGED